MSVMITNKSGSGGPSPTPPNYVIVQNQSASVSSSTLQYTGVNLTITTSGGPVWIGFDPYTVNGTYTNGNAWTISANDYAFLQIWIVGGNLVASQTYDNTSNGNDINILMPGFMYLDTPAAGTYNYGIYMYSNNGANTSIGTFNFIAYELK